MNLNYFRLVIYTRIKKISHFKNQSLFYSCLPWLARPTSLPFLRIFFLIILTVFTFQCDNLHHVASSGLLFL